MNWYIYKTHNTDNMPNDINIEERMQQYLDGQVTTEERSYIEEMISTNSKWSRLYEELSEVHRLLSNNLEPIEPSMRFTKNIMEEIAGLDIAKPIRLRQNPWIFRIAGGILGAILLGILVHLFSLADFTSEGSGNRWRLPEISIPEVKWTSYLSGGFSLALLMICTVLGLLLLDTFLQVKRKSV